MGSLLQRKKKEVEGVWASQNACINYSSTISELQWSCRGIEKVRKRGKERKRETDIQKERKNGKGERLRGACLRERERKRAVKMLHMGNAEREVFFL